MFPEFVDVIVCFRLEYIINGCGGKFVNKNRGRLTSPNYPNVYPLDVDCIWTIQVS